MKLSIIMPVFNAESTLKRSIASFQELSKQLNDVTLWVIDDCSTDGSLKLLQDIAESDININILINEKNIGPGPSRNIALEKINLGYIGFIDSDDEIIPHQYYKSFVTGAKKSVELITCNGWVFKNGVDNPRYDFHRLTYNNHEIVRKCLRGEFDGSVIFSIYSASLVQKHNLRFSAGFYEDIPFSYAAMMLSSKLFISNSYSYRKINRQGSIINTVSKMHLQGLLRSPIAVQNTIINNFLSNYPEFQEDFSYGMHGYIASAIISVLLNGGSDRNKIYLLQYLRDLIRFNNDIDNMSMRSSTSKDILTRSFLEIKHEFTSDILVEISLLYKNLFKIVP